MSWNCVRCKAKNPDSDISCKNCSSPKAIILEESDTIYGHRCDYLIDNIEYYSIEDCGEVLSKVPPNYPNRVFEISNTVHTIGCNAFEGCFDLQQIIIPDTVTSIYEDAFCDCRSLEQIVIPKSVEWIEAESDSASSAGSWAFGGCPSLKSIKVSPYNRSYDSRNNCNGIIKTSNNTFILGCMNSHIPDTVERIGSKAFEGCTSLKKIYMPHSVQEIDHSAFFGCSSLQDILFSNSLTWIFRDAFANCTSLKKVILPKGLYGIGSGAFSGCHSLEQIYIPKSIKSIGYDIFYNCLSLNNIYIQNGTDSSIIEQLKNELSPKVHFKSYDYYSL